MFSVLASIALYARVLRDWILISDFEALSGSNERSKGKDRPEVPELESGMVLAGIDGGHAG